MVAQTVTGTRTRSLEIPTTVLIGVILVPPLERLPLGVVSSAQIEWSSFPMIPRRISRFFLGLVLASPLRSSLRGLLCAFSPYSRYATRPRSSALLLHVKFDDGIVSVVYTCSSTRFVYRDYRQTPTNRRRSFFAVYLSTVAIFWEVKVFEQRPKMLFRLI